MSYLVTARRGCTVMVSTACSAVSAVEWIRSRRAVGADHFNVVDDRQQRIEEVELSFLAGRE